MAGNPGRRPLAPGPQFTSGIPACPDHLDAEARREWDRIAPELQAAGLLCRVDRAMLAAYCVAWARWVWAEERIRFLATMDAEGGGLIAKSKNGFEQFSQAYVVSNKAQEQIAKYMAEFGLSPSARSRLRHYAAQGDLFENDPLGSYMNSYGAG